MWCTVCPFCDGLLALLALVRFRFRLRVNLYQQRVRGAQAGEFCEVSNASKSDPAEWLAMVKRPMQGSKYMVRALFSPRGCPA